MGNGSVSISAFGPGNGNGAAICSVCDVVQLWQHLHSEHPVLGTFPSTEKGSGQEEEFKASLDSIGDPV